MTTTAPTLRVFDPDRLPGGPDATDIETWHLSITQRWDNGASRNIHLLQNCDLGIMLSRGEKVEKDSSQIVPSDAEIGTVVIALGVDDERDEIHYSTRRGGVEDVLRGAIAALMAARDALGRVGAA